MTFCVILLTDGHTHTHTSKQVTSFILLASSSMNYFSLNSEISTLHDVGMKQCECIYQYWAYRRMFYLRGINIF